jgi:anti-sigma B factor antagonist
MRIRTCAVVRSAAIPQTERQSRRVLPAGNLRPPPGQEFGPPTGPLSAIRRLSLGCNSSFMDAKSALRYPAGLMPPAKLDITQQLASNGTLIVRLSGKFSLETVSTFLQELRPVPAEKLVLDMSGVSFLDSAGVGALVQLFVHRRNQSKKCAVAALTQQGSAVLQVAGLTKLLPTFATVEDASA